MTTSDFSTLLENVALAGVYQLNREEMEALMISAGQSALLVQRVNLQRARNKTELLAAIGKAMRFPDWFGQNWDALSDCLHDMGWQPALGYVTLLEHCDALSTRAPEDFATLIDIFNTAVAEWRAQAVPFWCLVELESNPTAFPPLVLKP